MILAPIPDSEASRLATLDAYGILDTPVDDGFYDIVDAARVTLGVPMALVTLVGADRQWFKAQRGIGVFETSREVSFCAHTILEPEAMVVPDTLQDDRFRGNPFVVADPRIRFYLGVPLVMPDGNAIGAVCALDTEPRPARNSEVQIMQLLARQTKRLLELHKLRASHADGCTCEPSSDMYRQLRNPLS